MIEIAVDTNLIISLYHCSIGDYDSLKGYAKENILCLECLNKILQEDFYKADRRINFKFVPSVCEEFSKGYQKERSFLTYARKFGEYCSLNNSQKEASDYLYQLLMGKNGYYSQYKSSVISDDYYENSSGDCKIMAESGAMNLPLLTLNVKHFIGIYNDKVRQNIQERFNQCDGFVRRKFKTQCSQSVPITISEFLEKYFPEEYSHRKEIKPVSETINNSQSIATTSTGIHDRRNRRGLWKYDLIK